jgi:hypothetical protein
LNLGRNFESQAYDIYARASRKYPRAKPVLFEGVGSAKGEERRERGEGSDDCIPGWILFSAVGVDIMAQVVMMGSCDRRDGK